MPHEMAKSNGVGPGGYEYLWWVDYGGAHFPEVSLPGIYSAPGQRARITFSSLQRSIWSSCIARTMILRSRTPRQLRIMLTDRRPASKNRAESGHLLKLILDAQ